MVTDALRGYRPQGQGGAMDPEKKAKRRRLAAERELALLNLTLERLGEFADGNGLDVTEELLYTALEQIKRARKAMAKMLPDILGEEG